jgi:ABC-type glycerol-3-phosphate transport system substrate-binding protein
MKSSSMQMILIGVFLFFGLVGVIVFSAFGGDKGESIEETGGTIWGTLPKESIQKTIEKLNSKQQGSVVFAYEEKPLQKFEKDLVNAIAEGRGPDAVIIPEYLIVSLKNKLVEIPWSVYSERQFKDNFFEGAELLTSPSGVIAFPVTVDPLVLFWNRDLFSKKNLFSTPTYWDEMTGFSEKLTEKNENKVILKSAVSLGEYENISHAKELFMMLASQAGAPLVNYNGVKFTVEVNTSMFNQSINPSVLALDFFTQFSNPAQKFYSWNRSLLEAEQMFIRGNLAMYFGFGSQLYQLRDKNPNLNFDIAIVPQVKGAPQESTFAHVYAIALLQSAKFKTGTYQTMMEITGPSFQEMFSSITGLPSVRKDILAKFPGTAFGDVLYRSALISRTWLDPEHTETEALVKNMIESVSNGSGTSEERVAYWARYLKEILER